MKEEEIRPQRIFDEYLQLCESDTKSYFLDTARETILCPACNSEGDFVFRKHSFDYEVCPSCHSLYVSPRPVEDAFVKYYTESPSSKFWATTFYKETAEARREKLWKPKAKMICDALERYKAPSHRVIDIGGGYGLFAEEIQQLLGQSTIVIEPGPSLAKVCRDKSLPVIEKFLEQVTPADLPAAPKAFVSFELFEHLHNPAAFLEHLNRLMSSGDLFIFTTLSGIGLDIQVLWENSKSVFPPHHLNFLNPYSAKMLLERVGLEVVEVTTPGKLDVDILINNRAYIKDRFWQTFVATVTEVDKVQWQQMIAASGFSSHMMVICRKPR